MEILVIRSNNPFSSSNASNNRFLSLTDGLALKGNKIDLLITYGYFNDKKSKYKRKGVVKGYNYEYLYSVLQANRYLGWVFCKTLFNLIVTHKVIKNIKANNYDYIWLQHSSLHFKMYERLVKRLPSKRYFMELSEFSWIGVKNKKLHDILLYKVLNKLDVLAVMTHTLENYYKNYIDPKTTLLILPMTVDLSRFNNTNKSKSTYSPYIAYCGEIRRKKDGVDILVEAFIEIMNKYPEYKLLLIGPLVPKDDYEHIKQIIVQNNAVERIFFTGAIDRNNIPSLLTNADILALARPYSKQAEGGFPTKIGEYLATGNPVCVTNTGEIDHFLKDNISAFLSKPDSYVDFANCLERAITMREAKSIGRKGREVAEKFFNANIQSSTLLRTLEQVRLNK